MDRRIRARLREELDLHRPLQHHRRVARLGDGGSDDDDAVAAQEERARLAQGTRDGLALCGRADQVGELGEARHARWPEVRPFMGDRPQVESARCEGQPELRVRVDHSDHIGAHAHDLGVDGELFVEARPPVHPGPIELETDEMLLAHFVEPDARPLHPKRLRPREARAHMSVDVVGLPFAGEDAACEDEIALQRALIGRRAIDGDRISAVMAAVGDRGRREIDAAGLAVAPGFINMLSWAIPSLIADGRAQSDVRQGVTLEVFGEGSSMGPLTDEMRRDHIERQTDIKYDVPWTTLREGLEHLVRRGVSVNVASFVGATTLRVHEVGYDDRPATPAELERMRALARDAAAEGALGVGSALIYTPGTFASTDELVGLSEATGGMYISHLRNEGDRLLEAVDELIEITRRARVRGEIYHLKEAGRANWSKLPAVIEPVESARAAGLDITADMYTYTAGATGLNASMPPWVQEGGFKAWFVRLRDPAVRERVAREMRAPGKEDRKST